MRPFTKTDRVLAALLPVCVGVASSFALVVATLEPTWFWGVQGVALLMIPLCLRSRRHGRRRFAEIERGAPQRGWRIKHHDCLSFTEAELDETGLIKGRFMADAIRALGARGVERT